MTTKINILCFKTLDKDLNFFFGLKQTFVFVQDLKTQGIQLVKQAKENNIKIYSGLARRTTQKEKWLKHVIIGKEAPNCSSIQLSNGVVFYNYDNFDTKEDVSIDEMYELANELVENFSYEEKGRIKLKSTCAQIIAQNLPILNDCHGKHGNGIKNRIVVEYGAQAAFGGATALMPDFYGFVQNETHVDFHQMYSYILMNNEFPAISEEPVIEPGFKPHRLAIYSIVSGQARLKEHGFALLSSKNAKNKGGATDKTIQCNHEWFDITHYFNCITSIDYETFLENYDVKDLVIGETLWYKRVFNGAAVFGSLIKKLYEKRKTTSGAVKRFYKLINENIPGSFERTILDKQGYWSDLDGTKVGKRKIVRYNCIIGDFITAYGRRMLSALLHSFKYEDVIGYDTDAVFFNGLPTEVPEVVLKQFGDEPGQLHFDGIYHNVYHFAPKQYIGYDENNEPFGKVSGVPNCNEWSKQIMTEPGAGLFVKTKAWLRKEQVYVEDYMPVKVNLEDYLKKTGYYKQLKKVIENEESR